MSLTDEKIQSFVDKIKEKKCVMEELEVRYSKDAAAYYINAVGPVDMEMDEEYYLNIMDHLDFMNLGWFSPLVEKTDESMATTIRPNKDGSFGDSTVEININVALQKKRNNLHKAVYEAFQTISPYYKHITSVEFKGNRNQLQNIVFNVEADVKELTKDISKHQVNMGVVNQWMSQFDVPLEESTKEFKYYADVPIINGKMVFNVQRKGIADMHYSSKKNHDSPQRRQ